MATSRRVLGVEALRAKLKALPPAVREELQTSLTESAETIAAQQRSLVAVESGELKGTIKVTPFSRGGIGAVITAGGEATTKPVRDGQSATYDYALAQELGTQDQLAQPFFYPSFRQKKAGARRKASKAVRAAVAKGGGIK
jgi:HK97 gp10 family phage protein